MGIDLSPSILATAKSSQIDARTTPSEFCSALDLPSLVIARRPLKIAAALYNVTPESHEQDTALATENGFC